MKLLWAGLLVAGIGCSAPPTASAPPTTSAYGEPLEEVLGVIRERSLALQSAQYKLVGHNVFDHEPTKLKMTVKYEKNHWQQRIDGKFFYRTETIHETTSKSGGDQTELKTRFLTEVCDGKRIYRMLKSEDETKAENVRIPPENASTPDESAKYRILDKYTTYKLLDDDNVDGRVTFVIESVRKLPKFYWRTLTYHCKETGLPLRTVTFDEKGKIDSESMMSEVVVNPQIDPSRFTFVAPKGVVVRKIP
ncbi:MAG: hypothetical protein IPK83_01585 [Planctomycetes bacterium]|nr:hypothetical protein [Planctomycetota bacterium]